MHDHPMSTTYGQRLKSLRVAKGLTQEQLAQKASTTTTTVASHERDEVASPRSGLVRQLAEALEAPMSALLDPDAAPTSKPAATVPKVTLAYIDAHPELPPAEVAYLQILNFGDGKPTDITFGIALAAFRDAQRGAGPPPRNTALPDGVKRRKKKAARN